MVAWRYLGQSALRPSTQALRIHHLKFLRLPLRTMASDANAEKLEGVLQGDIWSKGFPKDHETYYLFHIDQGRAKEFTRSLRNLVNPQSSLISSLAKVKEDWKAIQEKQESKPAGERPRRVDMANALIAFTFNGLLVLEAGRELELAKVKRTDPAFSQGMKADGKALSDGPIAGVDALFAKPEAIHGLIKVAGSSSAAANNLLESIKKVLQHDSKLIQDVPGGDMSRLAGKRLSDRGKEHFGFEDGISQPLMQEIDDIPPAETSDPFSMVTDSKILLVTPETNSKDMGLPRPDWMHHGSFLVFRKLEQNVDAFHDLCDQNYRQFGYDNPTVLAAKLMGRWPSGAPIAVPAFSASDKGFDATKPLNDFRYEPLSSTQRACPLSAHIRKTNPRKRLDANDSDKGHRNARILRHGIPYGPEWKKGDGLKRGLLFACYQGHIEDGFRLMQANWSNNELFPNVGLVGVDPIIGQHKDPKMMKALVVEGKGDAGYLPIKTPLVTFRGGEYFFAPSIKALREDLSDV